jgi:hypothetical protein
VVEDRCRDPTGLQRATLPVDRVPVASHRLELAARSLAIRTVYSVAAMSGPASIRAIASGRYASATLPPEVVCGSARLAIGTDTAVPFTTAMRARKSISPPS